MPLMACGTAPGYTTVLQHALMKKGWKRCNFSMLIFGICTSTWTSTFFCMAYLFVLKKWITAPRTLVLRWDGASQDPPFACYQALWFHQQSFPSHSVVVIQPNPLRLERRIWCFTGLQCYSRQAQENEGRWEECAVPLALYGGFQSSALP